MTRRGARAVLALVLALGAPLWGPRADAAATVAAEGDVWSFGPSAQSLDGLHVWVVEDPSLTTTTDGSGHWRIEGLAVGATATFAMDGKDRYPIQTKTFTVPEGGLARVSFQSPTRTVVGALEALLEEQADPSRCVIASTVTRRGYSLYQGAADGTHGEPGATVALSPAPAGGARAVYFNGVESQVIWPDRALTETTVDGGVLFVNVPPGRYTLTAHKAGATIEPVTVDCRAGVLTNASPPWGLQVTAGGLDLDEVVPFPAPTTTTTTTAVTTTTTSTSAATTTDVASADAAPAAQPVSADPRFTG